MMAAATKFYPVVICCTPTVLRHSAENSQAGVSRAGARTRLQLWGHGDMQGFDSSSPAGVIANTRAHTTTREIANAHVQRGASATRR